MGTIFFYEEMNRYLVPFKVREFLECLFTFIAMEYRINFQRILSPTVMVEQRCAAQFDEPNSFKLGPYSWTVHYLKNYLVMKVRDYTLKIGTKLAHSVVCFMVCLVVFKICTVC